MDSLRGPRPEISLRVAKTGKMVTDIASDVDRVSDFWEERKAVPIKVTVYP